MTPELALQFSKPEGAIGAVIADIMHDWHAADYAAALAALHLRRGDRLLEIGMGCGRHVPGLTSAGVVYCGVDHSPDMVRAAAGLAPGARFLCGDVCDMDLPRCDKALAVNSVQWWDDVPHALAALRRALVPGGTLVIGVTTPLLLPNYGQRHYSPMELATMMRGAGFADVSVRQVPTPLRPYLICRGVA